MFLFADLQQMIQKPMDDFKLAVEARIESHRKAEADRLEANRVKMQEEADRKARESVEEETRIRIAKAQQQERTNLAFQQELDRQFLAVQTIHLEFEESAYAEDAERECQREMEDAGTHPIPQHPVPVPLSGFQAMLARFLATKYPNVDKDHGKIRAAIIGWEKFKEDEAT